MNDPIPITKDERPPEWTAEEFLRVESQRHTHRMQLIFLGVIALALAAFFVPLGVWLTRLALGG